MKKYAGVFVGIVAISVMIAAAIAQDASESSKADNVEKTPAGTPDANGKSDAGTPAPGAKTTGRGRRGGGFTQPEPMNFNDHEGYVSIFDGVSLKGWDGNPKFWRIEDGAIIGESTRRIQAATAILPTAT